MTTARSASPATIADPAALSALGQERSGVGEAPARRRPGLRGARAYALMAWAMLALRTTLGIWEWSCRYAQIPPSESSKPGRWQPAQARLFQHALSIVTARLTGRPWAQEPYAHLVRFVMFCGPSQIGKTKSFLHPIISYCIDVLRTNCAFLTHKQKQIRQALRVRVLPMLEATPRLARYLPPTLSLRRERLAGNLWQLEGANLHAICANVASDLREYSHPVGVMDEPEAYQANVDGEGDPIELFLDRQKRYPESSILAGASTPNDVAGHTWGKTCSATHRRLLVACEHCGHHQDLHPDQLRATTPSATIDEIDAHDLARWHCARCDHGHTSAAVARIVDAALAAWRWVPGTWAQDDEHPAGHWAPATVWHRQADGTIERRPIGDWAPWVDADTGEILGEMHTLRDWQRLPVSRESYQCNYLHAPDCGCGRFLAHELRARMGSAEEWHTHQTGWRAEPLLSVGTLLAVDAITGACAGDFRWNTAPQPARWLLCTADQQGNTLKTCWFAYEIRAVEPGGESWLVDAGRVDGFAGLADLESRQYLIGGVGRRIDRIAVDGANGNLARELRTWAMESYTALARTGVPPEVARARVRRLLLIGASDLAPDQPWAERMPSKRDRAWHPPGCRIFRWNIMHWKDRAHRRLAGDEALPRLHLPDESRRDGAPADLSRWLRSATSEERALRTTAGPGGRTRHAAVWQARMYTDPQGRRVERSDTHWWDACAMMDVLCDLVGAYRLPGVDPSAPAAPPPASTPAAPPRQVSAPGALADRRRHSRLSRRR